VLFDLQRREQEGWTVLAVTGELDLSAAPRVRQAAQQAVPVAGADGDPPRVVVDLSSADFLDSAGLGVVLGVVRRVRQAGGQAAVVLDASSAAGRVFSVLRLDRVIPVAADVDEVLARSRAGTLESSAPGPGRDVATGAMAPVTVPAAETGRHDG
jgi:anti-sigma B factor antagonist